MTSVGEEVDDYNAVTVTAVTVTAVRQFLERSCPASAIFVTVAVEKLMSLIINDICLIIDRQTLTRCASLM